MNDAGRSGEDYAAALIQDRGYRILERNYRRRCGEIDIIAENGTFLVFIEVKARAGKSMVAPLEAVTHAKREKIRRTALLYLADHPTKLQPRFDVAAVLTDRSGRHVLRAVYLENAFGVSSAH